MGGPMEAALERKGCRSRRQYMGNGESISRHLVEDELARVLGSADFNASERNRNFLRYVIDETLAGRSSRIKAYSIATSVFGRDERFDPQHDAIVRIEANRLRRALEHYYLTGGRDDPLRIEIPRGSYVPAFLPPAAPPLPARRKDGQPPSVLVAAFDEEGDGSAYPNFTRGFTRSLIVALTRFTDLRVFGAETALEQPADVDPQRLRRDIAIEYLLTGGCVLGADRFSVNALLLDARSGRAVWADRFERRLQPSEIIELRDEVANKVARTLAQPYGIIQNDRVRDTDGARARDARQLRYRAALLPIQADVRPGHAREPAHRPRTDDRGRAELCRGLCLSLPALCRHRALQVRNQRRRHRAAGTGAQPRAARGRTRAEFELGPLCPRARHLVCRRHRRRVGNPRGRPRPEPQRHDHPRRTWPAVRPLRRA